MPAQQGHELPQHVADLIWSRKLMPVISLDGDATTPFGSRAPIRGAGGMTMTYAVCPAGTGPTLHRHHRTYETFTVMKGRFEFSWGEEGEHTSVLSLFDTISVPPQVNRAFRNIGTEEGVLQVIITGGVHDMNDIAFPPSTAAQITKAGDGYLDYFKRFGLKFGD
jgi:quercetin dioxygenase-like cupin family protein